MTLADVFAIITAIAIFWMGFVSTTAITRVTLTQEVENGRRRLVKPYRSLLAGLLTLPPVLIVSALLLKAPLGILKLLGLTLLAVTTGVIVIGTSAILAVISDRVFGEGFSLRRHASAATIILMSALFPLLGWFLVLPLVLLIAFGTGLRSLFKQSVPVSSSASINLYGERS